MNINAYKLILGKQIRRKLGRLLLSSGGIAVGVWAMMLTTGLSLGVSNTLTSAINSQPIAREFGVSLTEAGGNLIQVESPKWNPMSQSEADELLKDVENVTRYSPDGSSIKLSLDDKTKESCTSVDVDSPFFAQLGVSEDELVDGELCEDKNVEITAYQNDYRSLTGAYKNDGNYFGEERAPERNELVACFQCGSVAFGEVMGVDSAEDLVGLEVDVTILTAPQMYERGRIVQFSFTEDVDNGESNTSIDDENKVKEKFKIIAAFDDSEAGFLAQDTFLISPEYMPEMFALANPDANYEDYGYLVYSAAVDSFEDLESTIDDIKSKNEKASITSFIDIIKGINGLFTGLSIVLGLFGLIAMIASVFGIINVMIISALERKKEIGILKSMGARNKAVFNLFLLESASLGFFGWLIGVIIAIASGYGIAAIANYVIGNIDAVKNSLSIFGVDSFSPYFPWWIWVLTLGIASFFAITSGVMPARRASMQNPVDVLRGE